MAKLPMYQRKVTPQAPEATAQQYGAGVAAAQGDMGNVLQQIGDKITARSETIDRIRAIHDFDSVATQGFHEWQEKNDITESSAVEIYNNDLRGKINEIIGSTGGRSQSKALLKQELESRYNEYSRKAFATQIKEQHTRVANHIEEVGNNLATQVALAPDQLDVLMEQGQKEVALVSDISNPSQETLYKNSINEKLISSTVNSLINRGQFQTAKKILDNPKYSKVLSSSKSSGFVKDIVVMESEERNKKARVDRLTANISEAAGRDLSPSEIVTIENLSEKKNWTVFDDINAFSLVHGSISTDQRNEILQKHTMGVSDSGLTDSKTYANDLVTIYKAENPDASPENIAKVRSDALIAFRRAQATEVAATTLARRGAEVETATNLMFNAQLGTKLAEIETAGALIEAKGEVTAQEKILQGKTQLSGNLAALANNYLDLDNMGGILNIRNGTFENIVAAAKSSTLGQEVQRQLGTDEQSIRQKIKNLKPLLINSIRQSSDMGARGLDSEKELEFYLSAATNEKTDIQSNMAAIIVLDETYGTGELANRLRTKIPASLIDPIRTRGERILNGAEDPKRKPGEDIDTFLKRIGG